MTNENPKRKAVWHEGLMCNWYGLLVLEPGHVVLLVKPLNATDMSGAIKVATAAMPDVTNVIVAAAGSGEIDIAYRLEGGQWHADHPPPRAVLREALNVNVDA